MSVRTITYNFNGDSISPDTLQYGGVRYEDNATTVKFILDDEFKNKIFDAFYDAEIVYRIDFDGAVSGYNPSENIKENGGTVERKIPLSMTAAGEQITAVLIASALNEDGECIGTVSSLPVKIYFDNVSRTLSYESKIYENISGIEKRTNEICILAGEYLKEAEEKAAYATAAADNAEEAMLKTQELKLALENGTEFIFLGGDSAEKAEVQLVIDEQMSPVSENLVKNRVITAAINEAKEEVKEYTNNQIATFDFIKIVSELPKIGVPNRLYLTPKSDGEGSDLFDEYIWANNTWEFITTRHMDLTPYLKREEVSDYIIENGKRGNWNYRKWSSGVAECWASCKTDIMCMEQRNSIYVDSIKRIALPDGLFVAAPTVNINAVNATGWNFLIAHIYSVDMSTVSYIPASTGQINGTLSMTFAISAKGRWK